MHVAMEYYVHIVLIDQARATLHDLDEKGEKNKAELAHVPKFRKFFDGRQATIKEHILLYHVLYHTVPYHAMPYHPMPYHAICYIMWA